MQLATALEHNGWQPAEARVKGKLREAGHYAKRAKQAVEMGLSYFCEALNMITFGIRLRYLSVWGAGTGVNL